MTGMLPLSKRANGVTPVFRFGIAALAQVGVGQIHNSRAEALVEPLEPRRAVSRLPNAADRVNSGA